MKVSISILLFIITHYCTFAQIAELKRKDINYTEIQKNIFRLNSTEKTLIKNISNYISPLTKSDNSAFYDSTVIDLTNIDTALFFNQYSYIQDVPINNDVFDNLIAGDVNLNNKTELYGNRKVFTSIFIEPVHIYELNNKNRFEYIYKYDSANLARNIYDIDQDGEEEVLLTSTLYEEIHHDKVFKKTARNSFATSYVIRFQPFGNPWQINDRYFDNLDGDQYTDYLFVRAGERSVHIYEYNPIINNFDSVYQFNVSEQAPWANAGFSIGDFDLDGKKDIVFGTGKGAVYVLENEGDNKYVNSWSGAVDTWHAYLHTATNDLDRNGSPEFWVIGDAIYNGIGITRITIFEAFRDNFYKAVGKIDLVGVFSFYAGTVEAVDVDKDGIEEVALCIDQNFLILKFNGSPNHHTYKIHYIKKNELAAKEVNSVYFGATMYDLYNDGKEEVLISMDEILEDPHRGRRFTQIYKPNSTTTVKELNPLPEKTQLYQNYPNPFNPTTIIRFELNERSYVSLKVFDILGKEIRTLQQGEVNIGNHEIEWDGKNGLGSLVPGGIYLINLKTNTYQKTIKAVLLK